MLIILIDKIGLYYGTLRVLSALLIGGVVLGVIHLIFKKYDI